MILLRLSRPEQWRWKKKKCACTKPGSLLCAFVWKDFQSVKPLENEKNIHNYGGRNLFKKKKRSLFRLIGTVSHWKQKQRSSHSPVVIHPKAHSHSLYSPAIKIRLGNKIQKHFRIGIWEKKTTNVPFYLLFLWNRKIKSLSHFKQTHMHHSIIA